MAETEADKDAGAVSMQGATTPPREKPLIEGEALRAAGQEKSAQEKPAQEKPAQEKSVQEKPSEEKPGDTSAEEAPDLAAMGLVAPEPNKGNTGNQSAERRQAAPPRRRRFLRPFVIAITLGALIAVGGAFALWHFARPSAELAALAARVAALEQQGQASSALEKRIGDLEHDAQSTHAALTRLEENLKQLQSELQKTAESSGGATADLGPLNDRIAKLESDLAALGQKIDAQAKTFANNLDALKNQKSSATQAAITHADADAIAILAEDLGRKVDAGAPFSAELAALEARGAAKDEIATLAPFAATGVATQSALIRQFAALGPKLLATEPEPKGFLARLIHDARRLIRIRKIGDTEGQDFSAQVARISVALSAGRDDEALRGWNGLSADARAKSQDFGDALERRVAAENAAKAVEAAALAALAKVKS
jgi:hypothetical protein